MKGLKMFLAWVLTVIVGSLFIPLAVLLYEIFLENNSINFFHDAEDYLLVVLISAIVSALCSLPTLVTLLICNAVMYSKKRDYVQIFKRINAVHALMCFITLFAGEMIIFIQDNQRFHSESFLAFLLVIVWYALVAMVFWFLLFRKEIREVRLKEKMKADGLLDE